MLPSSYDWLAKSIADNAGQPKLVAAALELYGTHEGDDRQSNPVIMAWATAIAETPGKDVTGFASDHKIPWCGLFMGHIAQVCGYEFPDHPLWAANWAGFGEKADAPSLGDVLVFHRPGGGGHVGLYVGESESTFFVLGGNERDQVMIVEIDKDRLHACRRPPYDVTPANVKPIHLAPGTGAPSTNEA